MTEDYLEELTNDAIDAFWAVVAERIPHTGGDFSIGSTVAQTESSKEWIREWVEYNAPDFKDEHGAQETVIE
jgi:hypothetical protein